MSNFRTPDIPAILTRKNWDSNKNISNVLSDDTRCCQALDTLAKTWQRVDFDRLNTFLGTTPSPQQYHAKRWQTLCDKLCRDIVVSGIIDLREAIKNAPLVISQVAAKLLDKKTTDSRKSLDHIKAMDKAANEVLRELRPEAIEKLIRDKETEVNENMLEHFNRPFREIEKLVSSAKSAATTVLKDPTPATHARAIGHARSGLISALILALHPLTELPTHGITWTGATNLNNTLKALASTKPLSDKAPPQEVTAALKGIIQHISDISRLPRIKTSDLN